MGSLNKKQIVIIVAIGIVFIVVIGLYIYTTYSQNQTGLDEAFYEESEEEKEEETKEKNNLKKVIVHIAGEVNEPGIVEIEEGSRIVDVVEEAGGFTQEANIDKVNLAYVVEDGQKIMIPNYQEIENSMYISKESGESIVEEKIGETGGDSMVDINEATQTQLEELPGIGPSTAGKIIEYRKENGKFKQVEDIKNVNGIGEAKFEKIKDYISVK